MDVFGGGGLEEWVPGEGALVAWVDDVGVIEGGCFEEGAVVVKDEDKRWGVGGGIGECLEQVVGGAQVARGGFDDLEEGGGEGDIGDVVVEGRGVGGKGEFFESRGEGGESGGVAAEL